MIWILLNELVSLGYGSEKQIKAAVDDAVNKNDMNEIIDDLTKK